MVHDLVTDVDSHPVGQEAKAEIAGLKSGLPRSMLDKHEKARKEEEAAQERQLVQDAVRGVASTEDQQRLAASRAQCSHAATAYGKHVAVMLSFVQGKLFVFVGA